jgi:putative ABC transport system permease protein
LNFLGLSIGIGTVIALIFSVYAYFNADAPLEGQENVYYLKTLLKSGEDYNQVVHPFLKEIIEASPEVVSGSHLQGWNRPWIAFGTQEFQEPMNYIENSFFEIFSFPFKYGDRQTALNDKYSIVLTEPVSQRIFGNRNPVGETVMVDDSLALTVTGVLEPISPYSTFRIGALSPMEILEDNPSFAKNANWNNTYGPTFLKLHPDTNMAQLEKRLMQLVKKNYIDPTNIAAIKATPFSNFRTDSIPIVKTIINGSIAVSFFVILIVLVNLLNLNSSTLLTRSKDMAVRKVLGSNKKHLLIQYGIENGILVFTSFFVSGLLFVTTLLPRLNEIYGAEFGNIAFSLTTDYPVVLFALALGVFITVMVSVFPSIRFIRIPIPLGIKGKIQVAKSNFFTRNSFVTLQFVIAILFISVAIILNSQIKYMKSAPLGFEGENITVGKIDLAYKHQESAASAFNGLINELKTHTYVKRISTSTVIPSDYPRSYTSFYNADLDQEVRFRQAVTDASYLATLGIPIIMGRDFDLNRDQLQDNAIIINRAAMKALGWTDISGKKLKGRTQTGQGYSVVGVMEDFHYQDMQLGVEPLAHYLGGKTALANNRYLMVKAQAGHEGDIQNLIQNKMQVMGGRRSYDSNDLNHMVSAQYNLLEGILTMVSVTALLTIFISCLGLFGLISFMARRRVKEIGIRKVLGAGLLKIVVLLSKEYIVLTLLAGGIAFPLAWYLMKTWLADFAFSITMQWWMFALAGAIGLMITAVTVGFQALKSAAANPVKSLRTE